MKYHLNRLTVIIGLLAIFVGSTFASNTFLEEKQNYSVMPKGNGVVHFKIPIWAYGAVNNYRLGHGSSVWYSSNYAKTQTGDVNRFLNIRSIDMQNTDNPEVNSKVDVELSSDGGTIKVTKIADGGSYQIDAGSGWQTIELPAQKSMDGSYKRVVFLEFDWYLPQSLTSKTFYAGVDACIFKYFVDDVNTPPYMRLWHCFPDQMDGADDMIAPELQSPYLYSMDENGTQLRDGRAAVPYVVFQNPKSYTTSLNGTPVPISNRAGSIIVPTTDSIQRNFYATFTVQPNVDVTTTVTRKTNTVDIPAYHRIQSLKTTQVLDEQGSYNGNNKLVWVVNNPQAEDLIPTDYFEIQRAMDPNYTKAQTVAMITMEQGKGVYEYIDNTRSESEGAATTNDTTNYYRTLRLDDYILRNADGEAISTMDVKMTAKTQKTPAAEVYYRVRRTSAATWYWASPFVKSDELLKLSFLAPLASTQTDYVKDPDFDNNHKVHFNVKIDNAEIKRETVAKKDCSLEVNYKNFSGPLDSVTLTINIAEELAQYCSKMNFVVEPSYTYKKLTAGTNIITVAKTAQSKCGIALQRKEKMDDDDPMIDINGYVTQFYIWKSDLNEELDGKAVDLYVIRADKTGGSYRINVQADAVLSDAGLGAYARIAAEKRWKEVEAQVLQQMYDSLNKTFDPYSQAGRCLWDRGAQLILMRTMQENKSTIEIIVPQDSIRRNEDGSWTARFTDVANQACTNYSYKVRIDPSGSDLRFQHESSKDPMTINGPSLYFNEAAKINSFTASQGNAEGDWKRGVMLQWEPSSAAVDEYVLYRLRKYDQYASPVTIYRGLENSYFDTTALYLDGVYEYTIVARYECNGKKTENSATAEGWRSPYGEISGHVYQTDNSGMAGVQVSISAGGQTLATLTTDASGAYLFDSLMYEWGTTYTISVTSQYGEFSYNGTKSSSVSLSVTQGRCVVKNVDFINTSCVRLTGRVLYDMSTIPVSGACFILNGDTIRRAGNIYTSGIDGNFELTIPKSMPCRLQVAKKGHTFRNDGWLFVTEGDTTFSLVKALDAVRFYDQTKVRLVGRVAGGIDQQVLPPALGFGKNNLGDDLQLVLMLDGDNTAHIVHDPDDLTRDTLQFAVDNLSGHTATIYEKKRIIIRPDSKTGEYAVDLFPVKYKVVQATAKGYASLLDVQAGVPTIDLVMAPLTLHHSDSSGREATYNARFDRIYRNPMQVGLKQYMYGMEQDGFGEQKLNVSGFSSLIGTVVLYEKDPNGQIKYLFDYPIFQQGRTYQFKVGVYEDYYYNNDILEKLDRVRLGGGTLKTFNGFQKNTKTTTYPLDEKGEAVFNIEVDNLNLMATGTNALRSLDLSVGREGYSMDFHAVRGFVTGNVVENGDIRAADADIKILDILRDPPGSGSSCYLEKGATYKSTATMNFSWKLGINIVNKIGTAYDQSVGIITAGATYAGVSTSAGKSYSFTFPIAASGKFTTTTTYTYTTTDKISTGSSGSFVGADADVFIGNTTEVLYGTVRAVRVIDDSTYLLRQPAVDAGFIKEIASATGSDGKTYHFVIAKETVVGGQMGTQFAYTQGYITSTLIPKLIRERNALLINAKDSAEAQALANARSRAVYWDIAKTDEDRGTEGAYLQILPTNVGDYNEPDKVKMFNNIILRWVGVLINNEREKVVAIQSGKKVGTFSVSGGTSHDYSESYTADWTFGGNAGYGLDVYNIMNKLTEGWGIRGLPSEYYTALSELLKNRNKNSVEEAQKAMEVEGKAPGLTWNVDVEPVIELSGDGTMSGSGKTISRKIGFTINPDAFANTTVSVYRAPVDSIFSKQAASLVRVLWGSNPTAKEEYGPFVFFQEGGTSHCPYEGEVRTQWYYPGQFVLGNATLPIENPKITLDQYSISNVPADQSAVFKITLVNDNVNTDGRVARGQYLSLSVDPTTNPNGAVLLIDGEPLTSSSMLTFFAEPGVPIVKTLQVQRGIVDDYEDIVLKYSSTTCNSISATTKFSVHFIPEASPVSIAYPRDKWIMNTLSSRDSIGYYLPVTIDGFNIHHKNFDHIEFQYKLSTENNDAWVNQCSFYADDSLYNLATGNKAKITNGRIEPFRFYGERDPKELSYDLRAVAYCRYGSGFVTKASPVISGIKDTRPPVLFGKALPANGILTLKDNISMRFSEPIAGNWLDEDNNFQILGVTNNTGITQTTSLYFDGQSGHYARTKAERELSLTDLSIDMLIKPSVKGREMALFSHGDEEYNFSLSLTADNRLKLTVVEDNKVAETKQSKPMGQLSATDFTRVIMVYDSEKKTVRFYAGTMDITDNPSTQWSLMNFAAPIMVGATIDSTSLYQGNLMELRVWTKAMSPEEISTTHLRRLTGYEYGLLDYYPMNENKGSELSDLATGATLFARGLSWTRPQGLSLATNGSPVLLQPTLFSRSAAEDYTLLFWFRSNNSKQDSVSLFGTSMNDSTTMEIALHDGEISFRFGTEHKMATANLTDGNWHHCALVISRTFNNGSIAIDGKKVLLFPALETGALSGTKIWLAKGMKGNLDDVCLFEQALPSELVNEFYLQSPNGEEMGLINLLCFSQVKRNSSGVMELVFTPNNQRVFKDANGNTVNKVQPLLMDDLSAQADKSNSAPVRDRGQLTKLPFTWNYQLSDLMINIKSQPREINKRTMYLTVRDVEDLNGNRLQSPVTWTVYVDLNSVIWNDRNHREKLTDDEQTHQFTMVITNTTGMTRQFTIENLPQWLTASPAQGTLEAEEKKTVTFTIKAAELKIGTHQQMIYLTDDQGLAEPLLLEIAKETEPPYIDVDLNKYPFNMSLCGNVILNKTDKTIVNTTPEDYVFAIYNNDCVGAAHCTDNGELYLTVHGSEKLTNKPIRFQLWKAATGKVYNLTPDTLVLFAHGAVYGCGKGDPVQLQAGGSEMQTIALNPGWSWISTYLDIPAALSTAITAEQPWKEGDLIKNPATRKFCTYSETADKFVGSLKTLDYWQMYMVNSFEENSMHLFGFTLPEDSMHITLKGNGQWNVLPCMFSQVMTLRDAMSDYYDHASTGDLIKAQNRFAVFSDDDRWVGDLTALTPGEGYLMRRMEEGTVTVNFYPHKASAPKKITDRFPDGAQNTDLFTNPKASTNMTMIAKVSYSASGLTVKRSNSDNGLTGVADQTLRVYVNDELAAVAAPITIEEEALYFITIQSDQIGELRFEMDGENYMPESGVINYSADAHHGTLKAPIVLRKADEAGVYKILENNHVVIIRNNEKYDVTGKKL